MKFTSLRATAMAGVVAAIGALTISAPASAQTVEFDIIPGNVGAGGTSPNGPFTIIDLTVTSVIDQTFIGGSLFSFEEYGAGFVNDTGTGGLGTENPDIDSAYDLYFTFQATGTVDLSSGNVVGGFDTAGFVAELWLDVNNDTTAAITSDAGVGGGPFVTPSGDTGTDNDGFSGLNSDTGTLSSLTPAFTFGMTGDDILIASATGTDLIFSEIDIDGGFTTGQIGAAFTFTSDLDASGDLIPDGSSANDVLQFFLNGSEIPFSSVLADFVGDLADQEGLTAGVFQDAVVQGSSITFQGIPEPTTLAMLGTGLLGLGFAVRRRRRQS